MESYTESIPLIRTKLQAPKLVSDFVPRPDLFERLSSGLESQLALVSAPAGYGKTTLVASWLGNIPHAVCWISLDENDSDLVVFAGSLIAAVQTAYPCACAGVTEKNVEKLSGRTRTGSG